MKQVLTVSCKLQVTPEQSAKIDGTLQAFAGACEYVNQTVPPNLTNELAMQSLVYHDVRARFGLSAQLAIHAIRRVVTWAEPMLLLPPREINSAVKKSPKLEIITPS
jgi:hypothetical protein